MQLPLPTIFGNDLVAHNSTMHSAQKACCATRQQHSDLFGLGPLVTTTFNSIVTDECKTNFATSNNISIYFIVNSVMGIIKLPFMYSICNCVPTKCAG